MCRAAKGRACSRSDSDLDLDLDRDLDRELECDLDLACMVTSGRRDAGRRGAPTVLPLCPGT